MSGVDDFDLGVKTLRSDQVGMNGSLSDADPQRLPLAYLLKILRERANLGYSRGSAKLKKSLYLSG